MLVIRDAMFEALGQAAREDFVARMRVHLAKFFPTQCAALGEERIGGLIELGIARAREHGFKAEREVCKYIDLMFVFGRDFDRDEWLPWARQILENGLPGDPEQRMRRLCETAHRAPRPRAGGTAPSR